MNASNNYRVGHRGRVRERFFREGLDKFAEYEILEILLFFAVPRRDTKGMAHALMDSFSTLHGVLTASEEELCTVAGIGKHTAAFLRALLPFGEYVMKTENRPVAYKDNQKLGERFVQYFSASPDVSVAALLLNNRREPLRFLTLGDGTQSFEKCLSSIVPLAESAYSVNAPFVVLAYRKDGGIPYPSIVTMDALPTIRNDLLAAGIHLLEVVCVSGGQFNLLLNMMSGMLGHAQNVMDFPSVQTYPACEEISNASLEQLREFLSCAFSEETARTEAEKLLSVYPTVGISLSVPYQTLTEKDGVSADVALLLNLIGGIYARAKLTEACASRRTFRTAEQLGTLFSDVLGARREEVLALAIMDENMRLKHMHFCAPGTVNTTPVLYRSIVQEAILHRAKYVALAHNHPLGECDPSSEDVSTTGEMLRLFRGVGIGFLEHFVVTDRAYYPIARSYFSEGLITDPSFYETDEVEMEIFGI